MNYSVLLIFLQIFSTAFGFSDSFKQIVLYNFSNYNITENNCNDILDNAKIYSLYCVNQTEIKMISEMVLKKKPKSFYQSYLEKFYDQHKEEIKNILNNLFLSYNNFIELSNSYLTQTFNSWIFDTKKFIIKNKEIIDNFFLSIINDIFITLEESLKKFPDSQDHDVFGKVHHLSKYSQYESDKCLEKYSNIKNLTCFIISKNYYIIRYNNLMNKLLN